MVCIRVCRTELNTRVISSRSERIGAGHADAVAEDGCEPDAEAARHRAIMAGAIFQVRMSGADHTLGAQKCSFPNMHGCPHFPTLAS